MNSYPADVDDQLNEGGDYPPIVVTPFYKDPVTGETFVHKDLIRVAWPWAEEEHVGPVKADEKFGDIESFVSYVQRHGEPVQTFLSWNAKGIVAVFDYHDGHAEQAGRCQWKAAYPFVQTPEFIAWSKLADGAAKSQKQVVEFLENNQPDIYEPDAATLTNLLRGLRGSISAKSEVMLNPDGTSKLRAERDSSVRAVDNNDTTIPEAITIQIGVLRGHNETKEQAVEGGESIFYRTPVLYKLVLRPRVSVDESGAVLFRFAMPQMHVVLEQVYDDMLDAAHGLLDSVDVEWPILRAAD